MRYRKFIIISIIVLILGIIPATSAQITVDGDDSDWLNLGGTIYEVDDSILDLVWYDPGTATVYTVDYPSGFDIKKGSLYVDESSDSAIVSLYFKILTQGKIGDATGEGDPKFGSRHVYPDSSEIIIEGGPYNIPGDYSSGSQYDIGYTEKYQVIFDYDNDGIVDEAITVGDEDNLFWESDYSSTGLSAKWNGNVLEIGAINVGNHNPHLAGLLFRVSMRAGSQEDYWSEDYTSILTLTNKIPQSVSSTFGGVSSNLNGLYSHDPINMGTSNYIYQYQDVFIPGRTLPLIIMRSYNSMDNYNGPFGSGWTFNYNVNLVVGSEYVMVMKEDGRRDIYSLNPDGTYSPPLNVYDTLDKNPDNTFTLTRKDQVKYHFSPQGKLNSIIDKNGNQISLTYTGDNLTIITDASGRELLFTHDAAGRIILITDPIGRVWSYTYDDLGNLIQYSDPLGGQFIYTYDENHWMTSITDPRGNEETRSWPIPMTRKGVLLAKAMLLVQSIPIVMMWKIERPLKQIHWVGEKSMPTMNISGV